MYGVLGEALKLICCTAGPGHYFTLLAPAGAPAGSVSGGQSGQHRASNGSGGSASGSSSGAAQGQGQQGQGQGQGQAQGQSSGQGQGETQGQGQEQGQSGYAADASSMRPLNPAEVQAASSMSSAQGAPDAGSPGECLQPSAQAVHSDQQG